MHELNQPHNLHQNPARRSPARRNALIGTVCGAVVWVVVAAVSYTSAPSTVTAAKLGDAVSHELTMQLGEPEGSVRCPADVPLKAGTTTRCTYIGDYEQYGVTVTITKINAGLLDDRTFAFSYAVDPTPLP
ncbi:DUF4333 domain-containing protein [Pseudonocardia phyllosphaerae]|uniref:DUF4333 domain-containing protein n=1 Tax=Pseudonocardia phyllosphaerae TaxID=3390502 RepID=UPI00397C9103